MIGTIMGIIKLVGVVCLLLIVMSLAFILIVLLASIIATILQTCADIICKRRKK